MAAAAYGGGISLSTDGGAHWATTVAPNTNWQSLASSSNETTIVAAAQNSLWISTNSGTTWNVAPVASEYAFSAACSSDGLKLLAAVHGGPVFSSTNSGETWSAGNTPLANWNAVASFDNGNKSLVANNGGTIYSAPAFPIVFIKASSTNVIVNWPYALPAFWLQEKNSLESTNWFDVAGVPTINGGLKQMNFPLSGGSSFFRLTSHEQASFLPDPVRSKK
jgi:hypothetical protein